MPTPSSYISSIHASLTSSYLRKWECLFKIVIHKKSPTLDGLWIIAKYIVILLGL